MKQLLGLVVAATTLLALPAWAEPAHVRIRGTVVSISGDTLKVRTTDGAETTVAVDDKTHYIVVVRSSLAKIEKDSYIGTAAKSVGDKLIALEVMVFPRTMKGVGEGHYGWDKIPDTTLAGGAGTATTMTNGSVAAVSDSGAAAAVTTTMTNGTVASAAGEADGKTLHVTYKGGEATILVPPTAPIVTFRPTMMSAVTPGASVFVSATAEDGKTTANAVAVGLNGLKLPM